MNVVVVEPGYLPYEKEINGLSEMQAIVGGYITATYPYENEAVSIVANDEAVIVPIRAEDLSRFEKLARQYGALYAAVQSKDGHSNVVHIISNVNYSAQLNTVLQVMGYEAPERGHANESKKAQAAPREKSYQERRSGLTALQTEEKPSVRDTLERLKAVADKAVPHREHGKDKVR